MDPFRWHGPFGTTLYAIKLYTTTYRLAFTPQISQTLINVNARLGADLGYRQAGIN